MLKSCAQCGEGFRIASEDLAFYQKVSPRLDGKVYPIPPPSYCYPCRQQRKLSWRNERHLYRRSCALSGKEIISIYRPGTEYVIYDTEAWLSNDWDPLDYGREVDFTRPFFEQFDELHKTVPLPALFVDFESENSPYTNLTEANKNCHLIFAASRNEDSFYSMYLQRNKDVCDCFFIFDSELCYECIDCYRCYELIYSMYCEGCTNSQFLYDCVGCSDCFACAGLLKKKFHIYNQPYKEEEYRAELARITTNPNYRAEAKQGLSALIEGTSERALVGIHNENVFGKHISFSKNCKSCVDCTYLEDCKFCTWLHGSKDCYDCYAWGLRGELGYENHLCGEDFYQVCFSESCRGGISNLYYSRYCSAASNNLFACIGLRKKSYCILNKQYSEQEYRSLVTRLIEHMMETKEWGEFFPSAVSPFGYGESVAQEYYPLNEKDVLRNGWKWAERPEAPRGKETISWAEVPPNIADVKDAITSEILCCETCSANFRVNSAELKLYRKLGVLIPRNCFSCRHERRRESR